MVPEHILVLSALAEVLINRMVVPALRPAKVATDPAGWFVALDYLGLFLFHFTTVLAVLTVVGVAARIAADPAARRVVAWLRALTIGAFAGAAIIATIASPGRVLTLAVLVSFVVAVAAVMTQVRVRLDGAGIGLRLVAVPGLIATITSIVMLARGQEHPPERLAHHLLYATALVALLTPLCFAPRPFARAVTRIGPIAAAMGVAIGSAVAALMAYPRVVDLARRASGLELDLARPDPQLAWCILGLAFLTWTIVSCLRAPTDGRRSIGRGLLLVVMAGVGYSWPLYPALAIAGLAAIAAAIPRLLEGEVEADVTVPTPAVSDAAWQQYVADVVAGMRHAGHEVSAVTSRGDKDVISTVLAGATLGRSVRVRIERLGGAVAVIDARWGREMGESTPATFTLATRPTSRRERHPDPPPARPAFRCGDASLDEHFELRGDQAVCTAAITAKQRELVATSVVGWIAGWKDESLRHRVYPGRGAPLDHPIPLSDLAARGGAPAAADRFVALLCLLAEIAVHVVKENPDAA